MTIAIASINTELTITRILVDEKTKKHLQTLGLLVGSKIKILSKSGGNTICIVKDGRLALDSNIATKIFVA